LKDYLTGLGWVSVLTNYFENLNPITDLISLASANMIRHKLLGEYRFETKKKKEVEK